MDKHLEFIEKDEVFELCYADLGRWGPSWSTSKAKLLSFSTTNCTVIVKAPPPEKQPYQENVDLEKLVVILEERLLEIDQQWDKENINPASGEQRLRDGLSAILLENGYGRNLVRLP